MTKREITATVFVIQNNKVLLIHHKKFGKWLPPGGHVEPNELPEEAAVREVFEETGLKIKLHFQENIWIKPQPNGRSIQRPYLCLLEYIPAFGKEPFHEHLDFIYLGEPLEGDLKINPKEIHQAAWFSLEEVEAFDDSKTFPETKEILAKLLSKESFV